MFLVAQMVIAQCTKYYSNCSLTVLFVLEPTFHMYTFPVHENISSGKKSCALILSVPYMFMLGTI